MYGQMKAFRNQGDGGGSAMMGGRSREAMFQRKTNEKYRKHLQALQEERRRKLAQQKIARDASASPCPSLTGSGGTNRSRMDLTYYGVGARLSPHLSGRSPSPRYPSASPRTSDARELTIAELEFLRAHQDSATGHRKSGFRKLFSCVIPRRQQIYSNGSSHHG